MRSYKYRIYPTKAQITLFRNWLEQCCWLYNHLVQLKKDEWDNHRKYLSFFTLTSKLPGLKKEYPKLKQVYSQVYQNVASRVDRAFYLFTQNVKKPYLKAKLPGKKDVSEYHSFVYPQSTTSCRIEGNYLHLAKIGKVKIKFHRPLCGDYKSVVIKRTKDNKWYAIFPTRAENNPRVDGKNIIGVDVGIKSFLMLSNGSRIDMPRIMTKFAAKIRKLKAKIKRNPSSKHDNIVSKLYRKMRNIRADFHWKVIRNLLDNFDGVVVEDVDVLSMIRDNPFVGELLLDIGWRSFIDKLTYKTSLMGKIFIKVNPAYTTQDCSKCGYREFKKLSDRVHNCPSCGLSIDRDLNAAKNILARGLASLGENP